LTRCYSELRSELPIADPLHRVGRFVVIGLHVAADAPAMEEADPGAAANGGD
jgi:hypothetical protein